MTLRAAQREQSTRASGVYHDVAQQSSFLSFPYNRFPVSAFFFCSCDDSDLSNHTAPSVVCVSCLSAPFIPPVLAGGCFSAWMMTT